MIQLDNFTVQKNRLPAGAIKVQLRRRLRIRKLRNLLLSYLYTPLHTPNKKPPPGGNKSVIKKLANLEIHEHSLSEAFCKA